MGTLHVRRWFFGYGESGMKRQRALFIGNGFTNRNDLPGTLARLLYLT